MVTTDDLREVHGPFDLIVCSEVLEHLHEPRPLVAAITEKLAPSGLVFVTVPNGFGLREIGGRFERFLRECCDTVLRSLPSGSRVSEWHPRRPST